MRLSKFEIKMIQKAFKETFEDGKIYLFGSRVDDSKRGGDIDLYVVPNGELCDLYDIKMRFLAMLQENIGEQKIDVIIAKDANRPIEKEALKQGVDLMDSNIRLEKYLNECGKHIYRIEKAYNKIKDVFPISATKYELLNDDDIEAIDQYLFRFAKLQDTLGQRIFKTIVSEYVDNIDLLSFIDILNYLEKIGILENANLWMKLRGIRNEISHQYDDDSEEMSQSLNSIIAQKDVIIEVYNKIKKFYEDKK